MNKTLTAVLAAISFAMLGAAAMSWAQGGMVRLATFGTQTNVTGIGSPCTTSCFFTLTSGTVTLNGATPVTITNSLMTANSVVLFGLKTVGGTVSPNMPAVLTVTPGTGLTVGGTALDTSVYNYVILN